MINEASRMVVLFTQSSKFLLQKLRKSTKGEEALVCGTNYGNHRYIRNMQVSPFPIPSKSLVSMLTQTCVLTCLHTHGDSLYSMYYQVHYMVVKPEDINGTIRHKTDLKVC